MPQFDPPLERRGLWSDLYPLESGARRIRVGLSAVAFEGNAGADFSSASSDFKSLGAFFCNFVISRGLSGVRARSAARRVPHLVGSRFPSPYHFRARIQSFQAVAAPFPGDSVLPSASRAAIPATETPPFKRSTIGSAVSSIGGVGTNIEQLRNFGKIFVVRLGSTRLFSSPVASFARVVSNSVIFQLVMRLPKPAMARRPLHPRVRIFRNHALVAGGNSPAAAAERGCRRAHACRVSPRALTSPPPALG